MLKACSRNAGARATRTPRNGGKDGGGARLKLGPVTPPPSLSTAVGPAAVRTRSQELALTEGAWQVQRIRELAGLENAAVLNPIKPSVAVVYSAQDVVESMRKSFGKSAQYVDEPEPVHVFGVRTTRAPTTQKVLPIQPFPRKGSSSSLSSDTSSLSVGPVLKRERSVAASTSGAEYE